MKYSEEEKIKSVEEVLELIREGKSFRESVRVLSEHNTFPTRDTVKKWIDGSLDLLSQYARACEDREDLFFDEIISIADETVNDKIYKDDGEITDNEAIQRSKLRVDVRKWALSKMNRAKYGDSVQQEITVAQEQPLFPDQL